MPPRIKQLIPAALVLLLIGAWYATRPTPDMTLIGEVSATRIHYKGEATPAAHVTVPFTRKDDAYTFANVAIDLNKDGKFAAYPASGGATQEEWVVRNSRAKVIEGANTFSFDIVDADVPTRNQFKLVAVLTGEPIGDWDGSVHRKSAATEATIAAFKTEDFGGLFTAHPENGGAGGLLGDFPAPPADAPDPEMAAPKERFKTKDPEAYMTDASGGDVPGAAAAGAVPAADAPPALGSDFEVFQPGVPDRFQAHNECVPTSISNGLTWLAERYGFKDKMPDTQEETMNELKPDLGWLQESGANMRDNVLPAKVAFTERHDLPIYSHRIESRTRDNDIVRKIAVELKKGQAVEIAIGYYTWNSETVKWDRHGGHMVSGVGAFGSNGQTYLGLHDPLSPETGALDMYPVRGARMDNYRYRGDTTVFIEWAYAQSPKAEWVAQHPPQTALDVSGIETRNLQDVWFIQAISIGTAWYPVKQFHVTTGPECDQEEHWHANTGTAWGIDFKLRRSWDETNPEVVRANQGPVVQWTDPGECGAGKQPKQVYNIMIGKEEAYDLIGKIVQ